MLLSELFASYQAARLIHARPHTRRKYRYALGRFDRFLGRPGQVVDLSDDALVRFRAAMIDEGLSRATANSYVSHLVALWNFAFRQNATPLGPTVRELPEVRREPVALSVEQIAAVLRATEGLEYSIAGVPASLWWRGLFLVLYDTGWRVSAARSLQWADVRDGTILIRGEFQKTLKDSRKRIAPDTLQAIEAIREPRRRLVFPWDRDRNYFWSCARDVFKRAGLPDDRRWRCHAIRRTHGTLVAALLGDHAAAESLQHSNVTTFQRHYRDATMIPAADVLRALPRPAG